MALSAVFEVSETRRILSPKPKLAFSILKAFRVKGPYKPSNPTVSCSAKWLAVLWKHSRKRAQSQHEWIGLLIVEPPSAYGTSWHTADQVRSL